MAQSVCITHPQDLKLTVDGKSSSGNWNFADGNLYSWHTDKNVKPLLQTLVLDLGKSKCFNSIRLSKDPEAENSFPNQFRFEISDDGTIWESIIHEIDFKESLSPQGIWNFSLVQARYVRLVVKPTFMDKGGNYYASLGQISIGISGVQKIDVSSQLDRLWVKENLFDRRPDYGWSSSIGKPGREEFFLIDLGSVHRVSELRLLTKDDEEPLFPENFVILASEDDITWHTILEESHFLARPGNWYRWRVPAMNIRFVKFISKLGAKTGDGRTISQVVEFEMYAGPQLLERSNAGAGQSTIPYASVLRSGLVRLGRDGEVNSGISVQGNDRRLRDATTESKGIVELATDGENKEGVAVQGNDSRLGFASLDRHGITRLCPDGEYKDDRVVTGNDTRLRPAAEDNLGIVQLARDGETRPTVAVQGNDRRLRDANEKSPGIVKLAGDGDSSPNKAVQGNDRRLRDANTEQKGILRFAKNGEDSAEAAVQGNDKRLKPATTAAPGIVEWAEDGENQAERAVQSNDSRLQPATPQNQGVIFTCKPGEKNQNAVVTGTDPRLSDARDPKPHSHDYADKKHDFSSHTGQLKVAGDKENKDRGVVKPGPETGAVFFENTNSAAALSTSGRDVGLRSFAEGTGVLAHGKDTGIQAASLDGPAALLSSQKDFAIRIEGKDNLNEKLFSSGKAIWAKGETYLSGDVTIHNPDQKWACIATHFTHERRDALSVGDPLVFVEEKDGLGIVGKHKNEADSRFVGIVVKKAGLILGKPKDGQVLVAISGIVKASVDASGAAINVGDQLVLGRTGFLIKYNESKHKAHTICARAMAATRERGAKIPVLIR